MYLVIQMIKIYFLYVFSLHPQFLTHRSLNPWNFLMLRVIKVSFVMLIGDFGKSSGSQKTGTGFQETQLGD